MMMMVGGGGGGNKIGKRMRIYVEYTPIIAKEIMPGMMPATDIA